MKQFTTRGVQPPALGEVVRANAKIHILKQFTTVRLSALVLVLLYVLMQRYTF